MPVFFAELTSQLKAIWARLDGGQRMTIVSVLLATLAGIGGLVWYAGQPEYVAAFGSTDQFQRHQAQNALTKNNILYRLNGSSIEVERSQIGRANEALAAEGVSSESDPERSDGLSSVTLDSATRRDALIVKKRRRAMKAVKSLRGVLDAYVTSDKPKRMPFTEFDEDTNPRATVTLTIASGESFATIARAAVTNVAGALGIQEKYITAIDSRTKAIWRSDQNGVGFDAGDFWSQQRARSRDLTILAQQVLDRAYPGKAMVTVAVDLDPSWHRTSEKLQPATPALLTEEITKSNSEDSNGGSGGDPSLGSPTVGGLATSGTTGPQNTTKSDTKNRTLDPWSGTKESGMLAPDIRSLSIALVLDETIPNVSDDDKVVKDGIEALVKAAVGFTVARANGGSDQIQTQIVLEFIAEELPIEAGFDAMAMVKQYAPLFGQVISVMIVVMFLRSLLKKGSLPVAQKSGSAQKEEEEELELSTDEQARRMRRDIEKTINEDPASISRMLESWLAEVKS